VTLYEKGSSLGGQLNVAAVPPGKEKISWVAEFFEGQLRKLNVNIRINKEVDAEEVSKGKPDVLIVATGSKPVIPDIPGIPDDRVVTAYDLLLGLVQAKGKKVVIVGASQTGCETAEFLAEKDFEITLVDRLRANEIALDVIPDHRNPLLARLNARGVKILPEHTFKEVKENGIIVETLGEEKKMLEADTVVLAMGTVPLKEIADQVKGKVAEVYVIGDGAGDHKIADAIYGGAIVASRI